MFKRMDFVDAIFHACDALGLDVIEVNNKVYAKSMDLMFGRINFELNQRCFIIATVGTRR